jgi:hypothetical protein
MIFRVFTSSTMRAHAEAGSLAGAAVARGAGGA